MTPATIARSTRPRSHAGRWELAAGDAAAAARCAAFLERLERLTHDEWLAIGRRAATPPRDAVDALDAAIAGQQLGVTAWLVRDAVHTTAHVACGAHAGCAGWAVARDAAAHAALAQLVRPRLAHAHRAALLAPFATLRPA